MTTLIKPSLAKSRILKRWIWRQIDYEPNDDQQQFHDDEHRAKLLAGGERAGKSYVGANEVVCNLPTGSLWWIVGPSYELARPEFTYIVRALDKLQWPYSLSMPQNGPLRAVIKTDLGNIEVATRSAQDPERLAGVAPDGILMAEAAQHPEESYLRCQGRIAETRGPLWLTGTFESSLGWYARLFKAWRDGLTDSKAFSLPSWTNRHVYPEGRNDPEIKRLEALYTPDRFLERLGGEPCPPAGRVLKEMTEANIVPDEFDPERPVYLWIDPGYSFAYAVEAVQLRADRVHIFDEVYVQALTTAQVIEQCKQQSWWGNVYGGAIDIAARQHHAEQSAIDTWRNTGKVMLNSRVVKAEAGLDTLRVALLPDADGVPKLTVHPRCTGILGEAGLRDSPYRNIEVWKYPTDSNNEVISDVPEDKNNHAAKAIIYGLVNTFGYTGQLRRLERPPLKTGYALTAQQRNKSKWDWGKGPDNIVRRQND